MISPKMRVWIEKNHGKTLKGSKSFVYMNRIQHKIDKELDALLWLCSKYPEIFLDEEVEMNDLTGKIVSHRRLKKLMLCLNNLNPNCNVSLVLEKLRDEEKNKALN
jgi:hypothetical protein